MTNSIQDVKHGRIVSDYVEAPFDEAKKALESNGYKIISLEENARLRMQEGRDSWESRYSNWTREGIVYITDKRIFLTKNSPIIENPKEATECSRKRVEYYLTDKQVEQALNDSIKLSKESIPTNRFKDNEITAFAFGNIAEQYGLFLKGIGIKEMSVHLANVYDKPFTRQMLFGNIGRGSNLLCDCLMDYNWCRGIKK